jgi:hypothetical protein
MIASLAALSSCSNLGRFDTGDDAVYCGQIIDGRFVRKGFERQTELALTLDVDNLQSNAGTISTFDVDGPCAPAPLFTAAPLRVPKEVLADPLSTLEFGESREYNFIAWVDSSCRGPLLAVVSLMRSDNVEVRLLEPGSAANEPGFGVFQLKRSTDCGP